MGKKPEDLLIWQYRGKPNARQTVGLLFGESREVWLSARAVGNILDIDTATGYALDLVGRHVGLSRILPAFIPKKTFGWRADPSAQGFSVGEFWRYGDSTLETTRLNDEDFRFFIRAKVLKNTQRPTIENILAAVSQLFGAGVSVIDNNDMTMNVVVPAQQMTAVRRYAMQHLDVLVRPVGVKYTYILPDNTHPFGWSNDNTTFGFSDGIFTRILVNG